jgi:hypothetical protein
MDINPEFLRFYDADDAEVLLICAASPRLSAGIKTSRGPLDHFKKALA